MIYIIAELDEANKKQQYKASLLHPLEVQQAKERLGRNFITSFRQAQGPFRFLLNTLFVNDEKMKYTYGDPLLKGE